MNLALRKDAVPPEADDDGADDRDTEDTPPSDGARLFYALFAFVMGLYAFGGAMNIPALADVQVNVPRWLLGVVGAICWLGAFAAFAYDNPRLRRLMSVVVLLMVAGLAIGFIWIGFGPGPRRCSASLSFLGFLSERLPAEFECRFAFGWAAVFIGSIAAMAFFAMLEEWFGASALTRAGNKLGKFALFASLAPLVLAVLVIAPFAIAIKAVRRRLDLGD